MIIINRMSWSNWFSYGQDNFINFTDQQVLQIMGSNGSGKTSIPIILQEIFYGKNSKGKKKSSLPNRYLDKPLLEAEVYFIDEYNNEYKIELIRRASQKIRLLKNGIDISSHTTTDTYKTIANILGLDFKTFSQLIYQSSTDNLEFLTATDTNRKKFLINLFGLNKYLSIQEQFKKISSDINTELTSLNSKISTIESWIKKHEKYDFTVKDILEIPEIDDNEIDKLGELKSDLLNIKQINKKINENNQYKELLENLDTSKLTQHIEVIDKKEKHELINLHKDLKNKKVSNSTLITIKSKLVDKLDSMDDKCHTCGQDIPAEFKDQMLRDAIGEKDALVKENEIISESIKEILISVENIKNIEKKIAEKTNLESEFFNLNKSIDKDISSETLDQNELEQQIKDLTSNISKAKQQIESIAKANTIASAHNSKVEVILEQLEEHNKNIKDLEVSSSELNDTTNKIEILKKTLGPSGLLSYKLDYLVKDLEQEINLYLSELSSGQFQLVFKLENEKLNIEIIDEGIAVSIEELSAGEKARINAATLLAIRKLMSAISSTKLNVLFLDEIMGVLDEAGKEILIDVLHNEKDLNTLLVSHEYSHPLIPKITIVKENKVSRIDG